MPDKVIEYNQPTSKPVPKMRAVGNAGGIVTGLVAVLALLGIIVPDNISAAATAAVTAVMVLVSALQAIVTFMAGYYKKDARPVEVVKVIEQTSAESVKG